MLRIGLAQINTRVGDLAGNAERIRAAARELSGADCVVFPELCLCGYPPRDLLYDRGLVTACAALASDLARDLASGPPVVIGAPVQAAAQDPHHPGLHNAALLLRRGKIAAVQPKRILPVEDVFLEPRWFVPGERSSPLEIGGQRVGLLVCRDMWDAGYGCHPSAELRQAGCELLLCPAASPYRAGVQGVRLGHARRAGLPICHVNAVGATDELVFDGRSFVLDTGGRCVCELRAFAEELRVVEVPSATCAAEETEADGDEDESRLQALTLGVRDFFDKNGLGAAWLGLSGGIDSAVVACIAVQALGPRRVRALALPTRYTDPRSTASARQLAGRLGITLEVHDLEPLVQASTASLSRVLRGAPEADTTVENIQARLRMLVLMAHVNRHGGVLLNTSNKTELALGYGTLYADLAGTLSVLGDVDKPEVYALARCLNRQHELIPRFMLDRPPSAELRPDQVDPFDYPKDAPLATALACGGPLPPEADREELARLGPTVRSAEHKRWQLGVVLKVSDRAFGSGRMVPVTRGGPWRTGS